MDSVLKTETRHQDPAGPDLGSWRLFGGAIGGVVRVGPVACSGQFPSQPPPAANGGETWAAGSLVSRTTPTSPTQLPTGQQTHCPVPHSHSAYSLPSVFLLVEPLLWRGLKFSEMCPVHREVVFFIASIIVSLLFLFCLIPPNAAHS